MPRVDDQQLAQHAAREAQPRQQVAQQTVQHMQDQMRESMKDLLGDLRNQPGMDPKALDQLDQKVNDTLDRLQEQVETFDAKNLEPQLARQLDEALSGHPDAQELSQQIDELTERAREKVTGAREQVSKTANDPHASDERLATDLEDRNTAEQQLQSYETARAMMNRAAEAQRAEREIAQIRQNLQQSLTPQQAMDQLNRIVEEAIDRADLEARKKRISMEMMNGEIEL